MTIDLPIDISTVKGFLEEAEGESLYEMTKKVSHLGACLEIGSYCGKSTVYMGTACRLNNSVLYALDHHRGSEEHQPGEEYHDPELFDEKEGLFDSFKEFRRTISRARLNEHVIPIVASSGIASKRWATPLAMVFIDGGHSREAAQCDYRSWSPHIIKGGILAIHDIFPDPNDGGQAPYEIWNQAIESKKFEIVELKDTLGFLRRV